MKLKGILIIGSLVVVIAVLAIITVVGFVFLDGMSYMATGSEKLSPAGAEMGRALVVYDPGLSGQAKEVARIIAGDLRSKGYAVDLAGVRSAAAANASGYDVIVTGGPVYAGMVSGSIASYLKALTPSKDARIGAFATGQDADIRSDPAALKREVAPLPENSPFTPVAVVKIVSNEEADTMCAAFVDELLK